MISKVLKFLIDGRVYWLLRGLIYGVFTKKAGVFYLGKPIYVYGLSRLSVGYKVGFFPGLRLEIFDGASLTIGSNVSIGQGFHVVVKGSLTINDSTIISGNVLVTDLENRIEQVDLRYSDREEILKEVYIGKNCFIGYGAVILPGTHLEDGCSIGANSVVKGYYPKNSIVAGVPSKLIRVIENEK
ncbi:acyltransferase [Pseudomonas sp. HK3]